MSLYKLFTTNLEIQYKGYFLSKAMLFIITTAVMNIILPFIVAYRSRGFWLKSHYFYEQPMVRSTYDYFLILETDDPSYTIVCGEMDNTFILNKSFQGEEFCAETYIEELDSNNDGKNDLLNFKIHVNIPYNRVIVASVLFLGLDFQITSICPLQMQSLAIITKEFTTNPNELKFYGDIDFYQSVHLPCIKNTIDVRFNDSLFHQEHSGNENIVDHIFQQHVQREVNTAISNEYSRTQRGPTGSMVIDISLKVPEIRIRYLPSLLQELKWAWPQYLSLAVIFYWILTPMKLYVFKNRFLMAWEVVPLKNKY